jgi:hypothetical protein
MLVFAIVNYSTTFRWHCRVSRIICRVRFGKGSLFGVALAFTAAAVAAPPAKSPPAKSPPPPPPPPQLSADQLAHAIKTDALTIPTPGELFAALEKPGNPNWPAQYRVPVSSTFRNRAQIALNLGGLIADGFIAVEAQDGQQVKNIGTDVIKLAKALGVSENVLSRGNSINEFADNDEWDTLHEELEATQNEVKASMQSHQDQDLVILVSLGGWIRGTQVVTASIIQNYDEGSARVLRQPALVAFIRSKVNDISPELRDEPLVKHVTDELGGIEKLVAFPANRAPSLDEVRALNETVTKLMDDIQSKPDSK